MHGALGLNRWREEREAAFQALTDEEKKHYDEMRITENSKQKGPPTREEILAYVSIQCKSHVSPLIDT